MISPPPPPPKPIQHKHGVHAHAEEAPKGWEHVGRDGGRPKEDAACVGRNEPLQETPPSGGLGGRVQRHQEGWALTDRCAGQCDDEVSHKDLCESSASREPKPTVAKVSPTK